ncbi:MAG TPA: MFS transporter [Pirellulales bacterium]|nr:MFS transporter [Pirellulales bacterium]
MVTGRVVRCDVVDPHASGEGPVDIVTGRVTTALMPIHVRIPDATNPVARSSARFAFLYATLVLVLSALSTGLMMYGYKYSLKDELHLSASQMAYCNCAISLPLFLSFLLGLLRDRWHPFGIVDRPYLLVSPIIVCGCCLLLGATHRSLHTVIGALVVMNAGAMLSGAAMTGMLALLSKHFGLSGRIAVAGLVIPSLVSFMFMSLTGYLVETGGFSAICYVSAGLTLPVAILAFYRPTELFPRNAPPTSTSGHRVPRESLGPALRRLLSSRAAVIAVLICFLWDFAPSWGTPLFYQFTNVLQLSPAQFESTGTVGTVGNLISAMSYAYFCFKFSTRRLLVFGTILCVVGSASLLFVRSHHSALAVSLVLGLTCGIAEAGIYDLLYRASPPGLEGVAVLLGIAATYLAGTIADVLGSFLYEYGGFDLAVCTTASATALILPFVYLVPDKVLAIREGNPIEREAILPS